MRDGVGSGQGDGSRRRLATSIARRLGIDPRTVERLAESSELPGYHRERAGSMLDPHELVIRKLIAEWPEIKAPRVTELLRDEHGYVGSVDLVRKRMAQIRPRSERPAQRTGYRPAQVMQVDWAEMPTRPVILGRERRFYALICSLPFSGRDDRLHPGDSAREGLGRRRGPPHQDGLLACAALRLADGLIASTPRGDPAASLLRPLHRW
jgi:hypothetical protein